MRRYTIVEDDPGVWSRRVRVSIFPSFFFVLNIGGKLCGKLVGLCLTCDLARSSKCRHTCFASRSGQLSRGYNWRIWPTPRDRTEHNTRINTLERAVDWLIVVSRNGQSELAIYIYIFLIFFLLVFFFVSSFTSRTCVSS